jgi:hypothetical protein
MKLIDRVLRLLLLRNQMVALQVPLRALLLMLEEQLPTVYLRLLTALLQLSDLDLKPLLLCLIRPGKVSELSFLGRLQGKDFVLVFLLVALDLGETLFKTAGVSGASATLKLQLLLYDPVLCFDVP